MEAKSMEINRNKQVKKKEFTELNHSIFIRPFGQMSRW